ncbi:PIG-L deacetylase family protein [Sphingomicrobium flavum]|uniref:PIG-L deacetylase family protein n=1 Tax=Sphingomicrobium flavum TaxID=1229164 RepID=UPI0021ADC941|nr:PIG-L deacetylase family protein [Sphingomicrobium flavum]
MSILVLAPHADDETLGMGGTIARLVDEGEQVTVAVLTGHGEEAHPIWPKSAWDEIRAECVKACAVLGCGEPIYRELPAALLDATASHEVNRVVGDLIREVNPRELYIPFAHDLHKDHHAIAYAAVVAARPYLASAGGIERVLAYETVSETHLTPFAPAFTPNVFVDISATLQRKLAAMRCYASQLQPDHQPRSIANLEALARLRGTHMGVAAGEAFALIGEYRR